MAFNQILTDIKKVISYSKARHYIVLDEDIYHEVSGFKARIVNFVNLIYKLLNLKSGKIQVKERIVEIPFLFKNLDFDKIEKILDLGCVGSKISLQLASLGYKVVGIDYRPYIFKHKNLEFIQGNFFDMNLPSASFDCVICISTIEHIGLQAYNIKPFSHGDKKAIEKIYNLLKEEGKLILTVPFGKAIVNQFERNYDQDSLRQLIKKFKIDEFKIFERTKNGWILSDTSLSTNEKVACIVCVKV